MNFIKQIERLQLINKLILQKKTGTPNELAERLGVSRRHIYNYIELMQCWGAPIKYSKLMKTFYYEEVFELNIHFTLKASTSEETYSIYGGNIFTYQALCNESSPWLYTLRI